MTLSGAGRMNLITGGAGFIGGHIVDVLRRQGERVRVLDRTAPDPTTAPNEFMQGSVTDSAAVVKAVKGVSRVFHLAALADLWIEDKADYLRVNYEGTRNVLRACAEAGVETVVHCSTEAILTACTGAERIVNEDALPAPGDMPGPYPRTKLLAEQEAFAAAAAGHRVVVVSPTVPIGPGDRHLTPPTRMMLGFLNGDFPAYLETTLNLVDVRDVAVGHLRAAERGVRGRRYVLGGTNRELSQLLAELEALTGLAIPRRRVPYWVVRIAGLTGEWLADHVTKRPPVAPLTGIRLARNRAYFDNRRARLELGVEFRPLATSLRDSVRDYRERGLLRRMPAQLDSAPC